jgi:tetratricopeptide (TPR) repeat protein
MQSTETEKLKYAFAVTMAEDAEQIQFVDGLKQSFCQAMVAIAHQISPESTLEEIQSAGSAIPHLQIVAEEFASYLNNEDLIWPFTGIAHFYNSQGLYKSAEIWYESCLSAAQGRFGENDIDVATSLNNLAQVNCEKGNYSKAEEFHVRAFQIQVNILGEFHSTVAISLNNLAEIYHIQGYYSKAEQFHLRALELRLRLLNELRQALESQLKTSDDLHSQVCATAIHIAASLNNLAALHLSIRVITGSKKILLALRLPRFLQ